MSIFHTSWFYGHSAIVLFGVISELVDFVVCPLVLGAVRLNVGMRNFERLQLLASSLNLDESRKFTHVHFKTSCVVYLVKEEEGREERGKQGVRREIGRGGELKDVRYTSWHLS